MGRRRFTVASSSGHHHDMIGLGDDDHTHYFLANGARNLTGNLNSQKDTPVHIFHGTEVGAVIYYLGEDAGLLSFYDAIRGWFRIGWNHPALGLVLEFLQSCLCYGHLIPEMDASDNLGTPLLRWHNAYLRHVRSEDLVSETYLSLGANPATVGHLRLPNNGHVLARTSDNLNDRDLIYLGADDIVHLGDAAVPLQINRSLEPSGADTLSLGSAAAELLNLYIGDAGRIYFGLAQDIGLFRGAANVLQLGQDDYLRFVQSAVGSSALVTRVGADADNRLEITAGGGLYWGSGAAVFDLNIGRGAANRLDLASGDSLNLVLGDISLAATRTVDGVDLSMYTKFVLLWHGHGETIAAAATRYVGPEGEEASEILAQYPVPEAATAVAMFVVVAQNGLSGASTVTLRKNGADTAITLSVGAGATGTFSDVAHSAAFAAGDTASIKVVAGADGANTITLEGVTVKYAQSAA